MSAEDMVDKFDGIYFDLWRTQMMCYLRLKCLDKPLEGDKPQDMSQFEWDKHDMQVVEINFDEDIKALCLLSSLPDSWDATVKSICSFSRSTKLVYSIVCDNLLREEIRRNQVTEHSESAFLGRAKSLGQSKSCCWQCGKPGHMQKDCGALNNVVEAVNATDSPLESWILIPGAALHCSPHQEIMQKYTGGNFGKIYIVYNESLDVVGKGDVRIKLPNGGFWVLRDVKHIPGLKRNLIFVGQLVNEGYGVSCSPGSWMVKKGNFNLTCFADDSDLTFKVVYLFPLDPSQTLLV